MAYFKHILGLATLLWCMVLTASARDFVLVIDAGHGGNDTGAIGKTSKEKR